MQCGFFIYLLLPDQKLVEADFLADARASVISLNPPLIMGDIDAGIMGNINTGIMGNIDAGIMGDIDAGIMGNIGAGIRGSKRAIVPDTLIYFIGRGAHSHHLEFLFIP